jgi:riboflavin synthase
VFTGIVECLGTVARIQRRTGGARLEVRCPTIAPELRVGDSVAVNGACVTVTERTQETFACDLVPETIARSNLGTLQPGEEVNLERPLRLGGRLDGHLVQGHVDVVGTVRSRRRVGAQEMLEVTVPFELTRYLAPKGSVAVDGVSLTVVDVNKDRFRVALIPHTVETTTLGRKGQGAAVNVEVDVISKYVERHLAARAPVREPSLAELLGPPPRAEPPLRPPAPAPAPRPAAPAPAPRPVAPRPTPASGKPPAPAAARPARTGAAASRPADRRLAARKPARPARRR